MLHSQILTAPLPSWPANIPAGGIPAPGMQASDRESASSVVDVATIICRDELTRQATAAAPWGQDQRPSSMPSSRQSHLA
jgi:hypothetical protein